MLKRLQAFQSITPGYFSFINNQADVDDVYLQIQADIQFSGKWKIYNKKPWESYQKVKYISHHDEMLHKALHIECEKSAGVELMDKLRKWISNGTAENKFGKHIKITTVITPSSPAKQVKMTIRMNTHGRRFQHSVDMTEMSGLLNPDGLITTNTQKVISIRNLILQQTTKKNNPMFLSITKKWGSDAWKETYIKEEREAGYDFASCPAAWLARKLTLPQQIQLYKHFTPEAVEEATQAEWDKKEECIVTQTEKQAQAEEQAVANIPWLIDLTHMKIDKNTRPTQDHDADKEEHPRTTQNHDTKIQGVRFDFSEDVSIKTTRANSKQIHDDTIHHVPETPPHVNHNADARSEITTNTTETRLLTVENTMGKILTALDNIKATNLKSDADSMPVPVKDTG